MSAILPSNLYVEIVGSHCPRALRGADKKDRPWRAQEFGFCGHFVHKDIPLMGVIQFNYFGRNQLDWNQNPMRLAVTVACSSGYEDSSLRTDANRRVFLALEFHLLIAIM